MTGGLYIPTPMSRGTSETVECPLCEVAFDPTAAGGWCTNSTCGEWQYDGASGDGAVGDDGSSEAVDAGDASSATTAEDEGGDAADEGDEATPDDADLACPDCETSIAAEDNFCRACGTDVSHVVPGGVALDACPDCGGEVDADDRFCRTCGESLEAHRGGAASGDSEGAAQTASTASDDAADDPDADAPALVLVVRNREIQVTDGDTVGREIRSVIMDTGGDEDDAVRVHREHVRFDREKGQFHLVDLGANPTVVNGDYLEQGDSVPVSPGDRVELSGVAKIRIEAV